MTSIGVISDTHGLLRPQAITALQDSDLIIHAGDIGKLSILEALQKLAPVIAIKGNIDKGEWATTLPATRTLEIASTRIFILHNLKELNQTSFAASKFDVVISGHSHQPRIETRNNILFLNPGSAGPRRFKLPITLARLTLQNGVTEAKIIELIPD